MGNDGKAARKALRSAIESWFLRATMPPPPPEPAVLTGIRTRGYSVKFTGEERA